MTGLTELQRTVLTRAYLRGHTLRQIGEDLSTPLGTIKTAVCRGVRALRADFARRDRSPEMGAVAS
jgi:DNA-directed RNA polymerase specialized sigma24 family protein